jgi:hypothetical protein
MLSKQCAQIVTGLCCKKKFVNHFPSVPPLLSRSPNLDATSVREHASPKPTAHAITWVGVPYWKKRVEPGGALQSTQERLCDGGSIGLREFLHIFEKKTTTFDLKPIKDDVRGGLKSLFLF